MSTSTSSTLRAGINLVPGSLTSCILITVLTVLLAVYSHDPRIDPLLRSLYFAVLCAAFHAVRHRHSSLDAWPLRLVELGFLVLTLGHSAHAVIGLLAIEQESLFLTLISESCQRGAFFLLGVSLITYGILLSTPALLQSTQELQQDVEETHDKLEEVSVSNRHMESRMVEADRYHALGELAAGVAHDLRNPLTIIKTSAESLSRKARSAEQVAEHSQVIRRNIEKAERTIQALLELGKPRELSPRRTDLDDLLTEVSTLVRPEARRRRVKVVQIRKQRHTVDTDPRLLVQALLNLVLNALQASPPDSEIALRCRRFGFAGGAFCALIIEDRGSGLQAAQRSKLFSPFFTTKKEGTGLGLLSCRRILEDLGGSIGLFPRRRGGARAVLLLPALHQEMACV